MQTNTNTIMMLLKKCIFRERQIEKASEMERKQEKTKQNTYQQMCRNANGH